MYIKRIKGNKTKFYKNNKLLAIYAKNDEDFITVVDNYKELAKFLKITPRQASDAIADYKRGESTLIMRKYKLHFIPLTNKEKIQMGAF